MFLVMDDIALVLRVPDGEDTAGLGKAGLLLNTADSLLENRRDLGRGSLCVGGIASDLLRGGVEGDGCGSGLLVEKPRQCSAQQESSLRSTVATP